MSDADTIRAVLLDLDRRGLVAVETRGQTSADGAERVVGMAR